jgi:hypothetical protein
MSIIHTESRNPELLGVICDRCHGQLFDSVELGEVLHIRLRAGYGSEWGDGNVVELDLCDACAHSLLSPHARVSPSAEELAGHFGVGLGLRHRIPCRTQQALALLLAQPPSTLSEQGPRSAWAWLRYQIGRSCIPLFLCLRPLRRLHAELKERWAFEEWALRTAYLERLANAQAPDHTAHPDDSDPRRR